jgi:DNA-binding response OmpR family regulator
MEQSTADSRFHILIVDDDPYIAEVISMYVAGKGYRIHTAASGPEALSVVRGQTIHLLVLDVMLPGMDGFELCRSVRETSYAPILMLTAKGEPANRLQGFGLGADDYMVKPFDPKELAARMDSLLRRAYMFPKPAAAAASIRYGSLTIDTAAHSVKIAGDLVDLTPKEYKLLLAFAEHPNQVLSRQQLLERVWGDDLDVEDRAVDVVIKRLRRKLADEQAIWKIETVWGTGYKFEVQRT